MEVTGKLWFSVRRKHAFIIPLLNEDMSVKENHLEMHKTLQSSSFKMNSV